MTHVFLPDLRLNYQESGDTNGRPVVFSHALGLDLSLWTRVLALLPQSLRLVCYDHRGHGGSDVPDGPYAMGALVRDAERLLDHLGVRDATFVGLSMGGLVAQGLAVKRPDQVRALVLSNTAAKIGTADGWQRRRDAVRAGGMVAIADEVIARWFGSRQRDTALLAEWRSRLIATSPEVYVGCCAALAGADIITPTSGLTCPALVIAGSEDGSTPPDLVRELADLIPGADFRLIRGTGHLPPVDRPDAFADALADFLIQLPGRAAAGR